MLNIIVETPPDRVRTIAALRDPHPAEVEVRAAGGYSAALSLARTRLADQRGPVVLFLGGGPEASNGRKERAESALAQVAPVTDFRVVVTARTPRELELEEIARLLRPAMEQLTQVA